jgi:hypothetical protein
MDSIERIVHAAVKRVMAENPRATGTRLREALAAADPFSPVRDAALRVIWESYVVEYLQDAPRDLMRATGHPIGPIVPMTCAVADQ